MNIMLTGATGFVGQALVGQLKAEHHLVCAGRRAPETDIRAEMDFVQLDLSDEADSFERRCNDAFAEYDIDVVCHSAARAHIMNDDASNPLAEFRRINTTATLLLANAAALAGVKRFIYISSIKVNGEGNAKQPYRASDTAMPADPYGVSKHEAEIGLQAIGQRTGMEIVIIRPPLVYGPGVKANFERLVSWVHKGVPLPLKSVANKRSMVGRRNLADLIATCVIHPQAGGKIFLVSDDNDLSTAQLISKMATALNVSPRLVSFPVGALQLAGKLTGRKDQIQRLCGSLQVDITDTKKTLDWTPKYSVEEELALTAQHFKSHQDK